MKRILFVFFLVAVYAMVLPSKAQADIAPPGHPPGFNPSPGNELTQVRMLAETVTIDVLKVDPPEAHVTAFFTMHNLGSSAEYMAVRFPIAASNGFDKFPEIRNVGIKVNDEAIAYDRVLGPEPTYGFKDQNVPWAEFNIAFPPDKDVFIKVSYDLDGTSYSYETYTMFYYTLSTGAGWKDTIGSGDIILRMPYNANPQNVILSDWKSMPEFIGQEAHWKFTNLEPTYENNLTFYVVRPVIWQQVGFELENIAKNPQDGEAYGRLGKAYKQALFASPKQFPRTDSGAGILYQWSKDAYNKAVTLKPKDGLWHFGYARLLLDYYYWNRSQTQLPYDADFDLGLRELSEALQLAPNDADIKTASAEYASLFPQYIVQKPDGSLDFLTLTQTPQPLSEIPTPAPSPEILIPTETALSVQHTIASTPSPTFLVTQTPSPQPVSRPAPPLCDGIALILLPLAVIAMRKLIWKL